MFDPIVERFRRSTDLVLTTHVAPDGDGLGSALGLMHGLAAAGVRARVVVKGPVPRNFDFFTRGHVLEFPAAIGRDGLARCDTVAVLDCSDWGRLADLGAAFPASATRVCIDHHVSNSNFAPLSIVDVDAAATAQLIVGLLDHMGVGLSAAIALPLYVALVTETGSFAYSNTSAGTHRLAARLIEAGVDAGSVHIWLDERQSRQSLALLGRALSRLSVDCDVGLAWITLGPDDFARTGSSAQDVAGLVGYARSIEGVEVAILLFEDVPRSVKVSFRSKTRVDVNRLAARFGGGGHVRAAGALIEGSLAEVEAGVVGAARDMLRTPRGVPSDPSPSS